MMYLLVFIYFSSSILAYKSAYNNHHLSLIKSRLLSFVLHSHLSYSSLLPISSEKVNYNDISTLKKELFSLKRSTFRNNKALRTINIGINKVNNIINKLDNEIKDLATNNHGHIDCNVMEQRALLLLSNANIDYQALSDDKQRLLGIKDTLRKEKKECSVKLNDILGKNQLFILHQHIYMYILYELLYIHDTYCFFLINIASKPSYIALFERPLSLPETLSDDGSQQGGYMELRKDGVYLVDKTDNISKLIQKKAVIFRRPRRSGKSLTVSMLKYYFSGLTQLFKNTKIYNSTIHFYDGIVWCPMKPVEHYFPPCPVIHLDFSFMGSTAEEFTHDVIEQIRAISIAEKVPLSECSMNSPKNALKALINALVSSPWNKWRQVRHSTSI